jgi:hypothetical protein
LSPSTRDHTVWNNKSSLSFVVSGQVGGHEPLPFHLRVSLRTNRRTRFRIMLVEFASDQFVEKIQQATMAGRQ